MRAAFATDTSSVQLTLSIFMAGFAVGQGRGVPLEIPGGQRLLGHHLTPFTSAGTTDCSIVSPRISMHREACRNHRHGVIPDTSTKTTRNASSTA